MRYFSKLGVMVFVAAMLITAAVYGASSPPIINYTGTLTNTDGAKVNGSVNMVFSVYSSATGGGPLWTESWSSAATPPNPVIVNNGNFNVMLGDYTPLPATLFAAHPNTFLGIKVGTDTEMLPRQRVASVGYSFVAGNGIPKGGIIMWSGSLNQIPEGWALCDGSNGVPDLRDRFVVGAGSGYTVAQTGGVASNNISHNHSLNGHTHYMDHSHTVTLGGVPGEGSNNGYATVDWKDVGSSGKSAVGEHYHPAYVSGSTMANTGGANGNTGSGGATNLENRPPYYSLAFIIKL